MVFEQIKKTGTGMKRLLIALTFIFSSLSAAQAQDRAWVQIEAQPTLASAQDRARAYATLLPDVSGFYLGSGWYGIAVGPYAQPDAELLLSDLRRRGLIPNDSFLSDGRRYQQQFWPIGAGAATEVQPLPSEVEQAVPADPVETEVIVPDAVEIAQETLSQARASEAALSREEREALQIALKWAGFYDSAIDGAFGRGTRGSMAAWQAANNHEQTGVLTTQQRAELLGQYNAVLEGLDLTVTTDAEAGVRIAIPLGAVKFDRYEPPFAKYVPVAADLPAQVLLISQEGDLDRLFGLYEILQTLDIVPTRGPRSRGRNDFVLEGIDANIHSYTYAAYDDGQIKGFTLVWPTGDEERRSRLVQEMRASFQPTDGVLDPAIALPDEDQAIDLVSGLSVRRPTLSRSGFFIDDRGDVLTTTEAVSSCERITIDTTSDATVVFADDTLGIAVVRPDTAMAPMGVAKFQTAVPRIQSDVAAGGYPYGDALSLPSLTFGTLADIRGLNGEETLKRLTLVAQAGDAGGPVFDASGAVLGMLLPRVPLNGQVLPGDVSFVVETDAILAALDGAGIRAARTETGGYMDPVALSELNADTTVLVSCW